MFNVLPNLVCLASYGPPTSFIIMILVPIIILGYFHSKARDKMLKEGKIKGVRPSKDFFDWMFYNYYDK